jgi:hypothetical protein
MHAGTHHLRHRLLPPGRDPSPGTGKGSRGSRTTERHLDRPWHAAATPNPANRIAGTLWQEPTCRNSGSSQGPGMIEERGHRNFGKNDSRQRASAEIPTMRDNRQIIFGNFGPPKGGRENRPKVSRPFSPLAPLGRAHLTGRGAPVQETPTRRCASHNPGNKLIWNS